jgi:hypothetical protein
LVELWIKDLAKQRQFPRILAKFDTMVQYPSQAAEPTHPTQMCLYAAGRGCGSILSLTGPEKVVDVYRAVGLILSIKGFSEMTWQAGSSKVHDTIGGGRAIIEKEHRAHLAKARSTAKEGCP